MTTWQEKTFHRKAWRKLNGFRSLTACQEKNAKRPASAGRSEVAGQLFLALVLGVCLVACDPCDMKQGIPPWHMWGDSKQVGPIVGVGTGTGVPIDTQQIVRINYHRPETWRWLWEVTVNGGNIQNVEGGGGTLAVVLQVTTGLGRTKMTVPLGRFVFQIPIGPIGVPRQKFTNNVNGPVPDDNAIAPPPTPNVIDNFVGQDIQVQVLSQFFGTAGDTVNFETTALFAPNAHIRPEWTSGLYPGAEDGGLTERLER
jgi:hypothetical protein